MQLPDSNLDAIGDPATRQIIAQLLHVIETQAAEIAALRTENQQLRDEIARLTGRPGKPTIPPPVAHATTDHSSEAERRVRHPRGTRRTIRTLPVTRTVPRAVPSADLPPGAVRHGTRSRWVQALTVTVDVIRFVCDVWRDPATGRTITASLPPGYDGGFCPQIRAWTLALGHGATVSQPALRTFLTDVGIRIGVGTIARWLTDSTGQWQHAARAIHLAGLASGTWQATDQTGTRVAGQNHTCHVVGNRHFRSYHTRAGGTRQDVLAVLWGQEPVFRRDARAQRWLAETTCPQHVQTRLAAALPWATDLTADDLATYLTAADLVLTRDQHRQVQDALGIAAYHAQTAVPVVQTLLTDDAPGYHAITRAHALCLVHAGRHLAKLQPVVPHHQQALTTVRATFWALYRDLRAYQTAPTVAAATALRARFTDFVTQRTGYRALDDRLDRFATNADLRLTVLDQPDVPLHTNDMELAARRRVRKRDVSFGPQSAAGATAWDTFQTISATATKRGVRLLPYLYARMTAPDTTPSLADMITARSGGLAPIRA